MFLEWDAPIYATYTDAFVEPFVMLKIIDAPELGAENYVNPIIKLLKNYAGNE
jgi:hypothetical protein